MKLTSRQAAEKLGVHISTVTKLAKQKRLVDVSGKNGEQHHLLFDSREVAEFAKTYVNRRRWSPPSHGGLAAPASGPSKFVARLVRIEEKLDALLRLWQ